MDQFIPVNEPLLDGKELVNVQDCVQTGWISSEGKYVEQFESLFSAYIGRKFGIAVSNGSGALDIAIQALKIGPGDEVILPTFTIISPALSIVRAGATPVLIDSVSPDWKMDASQIEARITSRTKAILVVHVYGIPANLDAITALAKKHNLFIIEDAAEMIGQTYHGQRCGKFGDISIFSFYANKHVSTGEGGMLLCDDENLARRCAKLRNLAFEPDGPRFVHEEMGWNYRMTNLQAAVGVAQLEQLPRFLTIKKEIGSYYQENLAILRDHGFTMPVATTAEADNVYWVFGLVAPNIDLRNQITEFLTSRKIGWRPFFWCMHEQPVFVRRQLFVNEKYPVAENMARCGFYLPSGLGLDQKQQQRVVSAIHDYLK
jgi:perosamine synthetase